MVSSRPNVHGLGPPARKAVRIPRTKLRQTQTVVGAKSLLCKGQWHVGPSSAIAYWKPMTWLGADGHPE